MDPHEVSDVWNVTWLSIESYDFYRNINVGEHSANNAKYAILIAILIAITVTWRRLTPNPSFAGFWGSYQEAIQWLLGFLPAREGPDIWCPLPSWWPGPGINLGPAVGEQPGFLPPSRHNVQPQHPGKDSNTSLHEDANLLHGGFSESEFTVDDKSMKIHVVEMEYKYQSVLSGQATDIATNGFQPTQRECLDVATNWQTQNWN